jgi:multidrug efflux pump subunit AcrB
MAYDQVCTLDTKPSIALSVYQLPGSNALETAAEVRAKMDDLKTRDFRKGSTMRLSTTRRRSFANP